MTIEKVTSNMQQIEKLKHFNFIANSANLFRLLYERERIMTYFKTEKGRENFEIIMQQLNAINKMINEVLLTDIEI